MRQRDKECNNNFTDDKREQKNMRRRATYRKKKDEGTTKLQDEIQGVSQPPLGDIMNVDQTSHAISGTGV